MPKLEDQLALDKCPNCNVDKPSLNLEADQFNTANWEGKDKRVWGIYACKRCGGVVSAYAHAEDWDIVDYFPKTDEVHTCIPETARHYLQEAIDTKHSPSASIMAASSSVDSMLVEKGFDQKNLFDKIKAAQEANLITKGMKQWAHQVRLNANDERHPKGKTDFPSSDDAQSTIEFTLALAEFLFVLPYKVEEGLKAKDGPEEDSKETGGQGDKASYLGMGHPKPSQKGLLKKKP